MLSLFEEIYPFYPQEPLLLLNKSGVFISKDGQEYDARNCYYKLALFVLLASKADHKGIIECIASMYVFLKDIITDNIKCMFEICIDMLNCFNKIQYVAVDLLSDNDYTKLKLAAK